MRILFYSDLHIRPERLEDCEIVLTRVRELALQHKVDLVVNGGDTFNTRGTIRTNCFDALARHYNQWRKDGLRQVILIGNHDQEDRAGAIHPMRAFAFDGWHVVDVPTAINDFTFFPYMPLDKIEDATLKYRSKYAVVHWGIRGAKRNDWNVDIDGVPIEWLENYKAVFSGHYHYRNNIKNIQYIGSPMQQNFGEKEQIKGTLLYDTKKDLSTFIPIEGTSRHYEINEGDVVPHDLRSKDFVKLKLCGTAEQISKVSVNQFHEKFKCNVVLEKEVVEKSYSRLNIQSHERRDVGVLAKKYVDFVETPLDKKVLMKIFEEVRDACAA